MLDKLSSIYKLNALSLCNTRLTNVYNKTGLFSSLIQFFILFKETTHLLSFQLPTKRCKGHLKLLDRKSGFAEHF